MKQLSDITLNELICMTSEMLGQLERFNHVSDKMPVSVTKPLKEYQAKLWEEQDRREDNF